MPRRCTVCDHPQREAIDAALVSDSEPNRAIADRFGIGLSALGRHRREHIPEALARAQQARGDRAATAVARRVEAKEAHDTRAGLDLLGELQRIFEHVNLTLDACDRWLRDPNDPTRYEIGPRAEDIQVTYLEDTGDGRPARRKARLSELLPHAPGPVLAVEVKHADPRELIIKAADSLKGQLELLGNIAQALYSVQETRAFQDEVLKVLDECEPGLRGRIVTRLRERRQIRSVAGGSR